MSLTLPKRCEISLPALILPQAHWSFSALTQQFFSAIPIKPAVSTFNFISKASSCPMLSYNQSHARNIDFNSNVFCEVISPLAQVKMSFLQIPGLWRAPATLLNISLMTMETLRFSFIYSCGGGLFWFHSSN